MAPELLDRRGFGNGHGPNPRARSTRITFEERHLRRISGERSVGVLQGEPEVG